MNLSFCGCGFLGIYHVGVAVCFKKYAPHLLLNKICGTSAGAIAACCLLCDLPLGEITSNVLRVTREVREHTLGAFSPLFSIHDILLESLQKFLPEDAHIRVSGKLYISMTRLYDRKNVVVSHYNSREDLVQALLATSFIPFFSGMLPPRFRGVRYIDGCFSDNLPILDENTVTVSPFCGESDICPRDTSSQLFHVIVANMSIELSKQNIYRSIRILFPPNPKILSDMCKQGFDDALRFLHRNNLINCTRCLAVQSTFVISETLDEGIEYDPECLECKTHRQEALVANLPETVLTIFQDAIDSTNKGLVNWFFKHKSVKLLPLLSLPYTLPINVVYATFTKLILNVPKLRSNLVEMGRYILEQLNYILPQIKSIYYQPKSQTIKCQLAITEYGSSIYDKAPESNDALCKNLNLTLEYNKLQLWNECNDKTNVGAVDDTFENILQVTTDQTAVITYYYMDENDKVQVTEIFDVTDTDSHGMLSNDEVETNSKLQFDEWDEPTWLSQHTLNDVTMESLCAETNQESLENLFDISLDEDNLNNSNFFSDPESEWEMEKSKEEKQQPYNHPDSRPEVDQPSLSIED